GPAMIRMRTVIAVVSLLGGTVLAAVPASAASAGPPIAARPGPIAALLADRPLPAIARHGLSPAITGDDATLSGVTCASTSSCLASGFFFAAAEGGFTFGLSEVWNGHSWGTITVGGLTTKDDVTDTLEVSCGAPTNCMTVGEHFNNPKLPVQFADILSAGWTPVKWN